MVYGHIYIVLCKHVSGTAFLGQNNRCDPPPKKILGMDAIDI